MGQSGAIHSITCYQFPASCIIHGPSPVIKQFLSFLLTVLNINDFIFARVFRPMLSIAWYRSSLMT